MEETADNRIRFVSGESGEPAAVIVPIELWREMGQLQRVPGARRRSRGPGSVGTTAGPGRKIMRALLIRSPNIERILDGNKTWEIRGSRTNVRGLIGLIRSRSGTVLGVCDLVDCLGPFTAGQLRKNARKAGMTPSEANVGIYRKTFAWLLANPRYLKTPVSYKHPRGAVVWVKLQAQTERDVRRT